MEATLVEFLRANRRAFLFCRDETGRPIGYAMQCIRCDGHSLYFSTYTKSPKVKHLRADPAAACLVLSEPGGSDGAWASVRGTAQVYQPSTEEIDELIGAGSPDGRVPDRVVAGVRDRLTTGKRCLIRLDIDEVCAHAP
jgi:nitroimidazol reductase NimA-like FMN-containing flavoprotein (pyridoxamine 5'-phosphate oxidase superfamily)